MQAPIHVFKIKYHPSRHKQQQFLTLRLQTLPVNLMAYIPPHMRRSEDVRKASPFPETLQPQFQRILNLRASTSHQNRCGNTVYARHAISKWFAVGLDDDGQFPPNIHLEPTSLEHVERDRGEKPLILVNSFVTEEDCKPERNCSKSPWEIIAENVHQELVSSFEILRKEMDGQGSEKVKPTLVARLGKIHFRGSPSVGLESVNKTQVEEAILRKLRRSLYTDIPSSYVEIIRDGVVPVLGVDFDGEKDVYLVKLSDNTKPDATIACKCRVMENKKLALYKDDEMSDLINSAVLDSDMKGGLRWPLRASSGGRYSVIGTWHTEPGAESHSISSMLEDSLRLIWDKFLL
ncbi:hypothetical protein DKX38_029134 [Salix brachista]|uniref:DUF7903 domain-containing protein n=1 Tax=Salix brachista TaxID=2182728 RepID=A0A5N5J0X2_9ROSI|nr:hypothetical protein DKX38_029134 [Salix brachista]